MTKPICLLMPLMAVSFLANCGNNEVHTMCLVSFNTDGGSFIPSQKVEKGKTITEPDKPTKTDYYFRGWLLDGNNFDFATPIEQNITLTANWNLYEFDYDDDCPYLTFNAEEDSVARYDINGTVDVDMKYSTDMNNWVTWGENVIVEIKKGNKIYIKNEKDHLSIDDNNYVQFYLGGKIAASGDISSLTQSNTLGNYEYIYLFYECYGLIRAPKLPATTVAEGCYESTFEECISLKKAPKLPALTLAKGCYNNMFYDCYGLIEVPELPALTLAKECYLYMFYDCYNLKNLPAKLPAITLEEGCYKYMFGSCYGLKEAPELLATTLANDCCHAMFMDCYSLKKAPELLATELKNGCYSYMFQNCYNLNKVEVGFGEAGSPDWPAGDYTNSWLDFAGVATHSAPVFIWGGTDEVDPRDASHVPTGWIINPAQ